MNWEAMLATVDWQRLVTTVVLVFGLVLIRLLVVKQIKASKLHNETRRQWIVRTRSLLVLIVLGALVLIWGTELRAFAVSLLAVVVAMVIACKELILCLTGNLLRATSQSFSVGDKIQVKDLRGYVIDQNMLTTKMLELGPGRTGQMQTGSLIAIPNSWFLDGAVVNETFMEDYILYVFTVPMELGGQWRGAQQRLLEIATEESAAFAVRAERHIRTLERTHGLDLPGIEPRVTIHLPEPGRVDLNVRIPVRADRRGQTEQRILSRFLEEFASPGKGSEDAGHAS